MSRDDQMDGLLKRTLRSPGQGGPGENCLAADTVAAWADGSLRVEERELVEAHASGCDRCLALLAAVEESAGASRPAVGDAAWKRWLAPRWLVPLAAAAAIAFFIVSDRRQDPAPVGQLSKAVPEARVTPASPPVSASPDANLAYTRRPADARKDTQDTEAGRSRPASVGTAARKRDEQKKAPIQEMAARADGGVAGLARPTTAAPAATPPAAAPGVPPPPVPSPAPAQAQEAAPPPASPATAQAERAASLLDDLSVSGRRERAFDAVEVRSPNPAVRWRLTDRSIEKSEDGGATWQLQHSLGLSGGAARMPRRAPAESTVVRLTGAAPSAAVCWVVGPAGTVLLTTDGRTWRRIEFPDRADLAGVAAADASNATITTADGRVFRTRDGGRSWLLQETPAAPF